MERLTKVLLIGVLIYGVVGIMAVKAVNKLDKVFQEQEKRFQQVLTINY